MGKLSHITSRMDKAQPPQNLEGIIEGIAHSMSATVSKALADDFTRGRDDLSAVSCVVDSITPAIQAAVSEAVESLRPALAKLSKDLAKKPDSHAELLKMQGRIVSAMGKVRIPDHAEQLRRIEAKTTDIEPILSKIEAIEFPEHEERPEKWVFHVKRTSNGLISEVIATAEDD